MFKKYVDAINKIRSHPGRIAKVRWSRLLTREIKAEYRDEICIRKATTAVVRLNVQYDHRASVIEARESGELPSENKGLSGMTWVDRYENIILRSNITGKLYLRVYHAMEMHHEPVIEYYIDGKTTPLDDNQLKEYLISSQFNKKHRPFDCQNICLDDIVDIGVP